MNDPRVMEQAERDGMWLMSDLGYSFVCSCNWRSGIHRDHGVIEDRLAVHVDEAHRG